MNERIKELALQAGLKQRIWNSLGKELPMWQEDPDNPGLEKFTELIVRECLNQCYNRGMNDELYAGQLKAATYIEEHFGVEN